MRGKYPLVRRWDNFNEIHRGKKELQSKHSGTKIEKEMVEKKVQSTEGLGS